MSNIEPNLELAALFVALKDQGASHILISFSGSGDSGDFDQQNLFLAVLLPIMVILTYTTKMDVKNFKTRRLKWK